MTDNTDEASFRALFKAAQNLEESEVQKWLATELKRRRNGQYTVERESEVDRRKKPDIRLCNSTCFGPATIELKIADKWSYAQLEKALREQLVGQYLVANDSRHGIFLLCRMRKKARWRPSRARNLDFGAVLQQLQGAADVLRQEGRATALQVIGIDFL